MMIDVGVILAAAGLLVVVLYWSGRHGDRGRGAGTSLRRGPRAHTSLNGKPKMAYATRDEAAARARSMTRRDGAPMSVYRCGTCTKWHLGHEK
jgi:hypothetical protein